MTLKFWSSVTKKVLLGLSDAQLLTGIAMQLTALIDHCKLSIYHFWIAVNLAQLSTVTHLMTMVALRQYFLEHAHSSIVRVVLILFNVALYLYQAYVGDAIAYSNSIGDYSQSLACYYQGSRPSIKNNNGLRHYWIASLVLIIVLHATLLYIVFLSHRNNGIKVWWKKWLLRLPIIVASAYMLLAIVVLAVNVIPNTQALGKSLVTIGGSEREWDFGQLLPMFLLAIPLLAGWETAWGESCLAKASNYQY